MQPLTRAIPKELLPLGQKPVLQHIVEELQQAGLGQILIITRRDKPAIEAHFAKLAGIQFSYQPEPLGLGHAILQAREFVGDEHFVVALADSPIGGPHANTLLPNLIQAHKRLNAVATIAIERVAPSDRHRRGIVIPVSDASDTALRLRDIIEKPSAQVTNSTWAIACRYIFDAAIFTTLSQTRPDPTGEIQLSDAIRRLIHTGQPVYGVPLTEGQQRYDTGNFKDYFRAFADFAKEKPPKS